MLAAAAAAAAKGRGGSAPQAVTHVSSAHASSAAPGKQADDHALGLVLLIASTASTTTPARISSGSSSPMVYPAGRRSSRCGLAMPGASGVDPPPPEVSLGGPPPPRQRVPSPVLPGPAQGSTLAEMPHAWLGGLSVAVGPADALALLRTCRTLRDVVLGCRRVAFETCMLAACEAHCAQAVYRLHTVLRHCREVRLAFEFLWMSQDGNCASEEGQQQQRHQVGPCVAQLLRGVVLQAGGRPLGNVTEIHLQNMELPELLPIWLARACPNLRRLSISHCTIPLLPAAAPDADAVEPNDTTAAATVPVSGGQAEPPPATCPHLKELRFEASACAAALAQGLWRQRAALPALVHLHLPEWRLADATEVSSSVTRLTVDQRWLPGPVLQALHVQFPCLTRLAMPRTTVMGAEGLGALLRLRHLTHLHCFGFSLRDAPLPAPPKPLQTQLPGHDSPHLSCGGNGGACRWAMMMVETMDVDSFAQLPLAGIASCTGVSRITASSDRWAVGRVLSAVRCWGGACTTEHVTLDYTPQGQQGQQATCLALTTLPLVAALTGVQRLTLDQFKELNEDMLRALGRHLPAGLETLTFEYCSCAPAAWRSVLPSLPRVRQVRLHWCGLSTEQLAALCAAADRPVTVAAISRRIVGEEARALVRRRLEEAGHQHVSLVVDECQ